MKQAYHILFLFLAIVFSFGFTISEPACKMQGEETHSCCKKAEKETPSKECDGLCCIQSTTIARIEEGTVESLNVEVNKLKPTVVEANFDLFNFSSIYEFNKLLELKTVHPPIKIPVFKSIKTQTWLI